MNAQTEPEILTLSQVRHDLNLLPKRFESNPLPILVEHQGKPTLAILPLELYLAMEGALDFIGEKGLDAEFETWMDALEEEMGACESGEISREKSPAEGSESALQAMLETDPEFRRNYLESLKKRLQWVESLEISLTNQ